MAAYFAPRAVVIATLAAGAHAQTFQGLGMLPGHAASGARAVSGDGLTVVGVSAELTTVGNPRPFRWTAAMGMQPLPVLAGSTQSAALAVSTDGSVAAGESRTQSSIAVRWEGDIQSLGLIAGSPFSIATGISGDGQRIVGRSGNFGAFSWTGSAGMVALPPLPPGNAAQAWGISSDGAVAVGDSQSGATSTAVRWTPAGVEDLVSPAGAAITSAQAASADGGVIVGWGILAGVSNNRAFRWTPAGGMQFFGVLPGGTFSHARGVSGDGLVVVGTASGANAVRASFIWTPALGLRNLREFLAEQGANLSGWTGIDAHGISADGRTIVGEGIGPGGHEQAWIATIPGWAACAANCDGSSQPPALNVADFTCFLQLFASGSDHANCDFSTAPPTLNVADFTCFLQKFAAGCP